MADTHRDDIAKLEALYAENPEGRVFIHLAEAYRRAGELDRALEVVQDGISRYTEDSSAHVVLGRVLEDRQQDDEAAAAFRRVLELDAHNLVALRGLGDLAFRAGHHQAALEYFERLAELEPPDGELEALIEALRSGPAGMTEALQQWDEAESEPESRAEAVDFVGGAMEGIDEVASEPLAGEAEPPESALDAEPPAEDPGDRLEEPWAAAEVAPVPEPTDEEMTFAGPESTDLPEAETSGSVDTWQAADEDSEALPPAESEPEGPSGPVEGLEPEDELRGADAAGAIQALEVNERGFHDAEPPDDALPAVGGVEGLQTADAPLAGEPPQDMTWDEDEDVEGVAAEATQTVFTETMAQVYARQGLYDRAADVYRELLRQRPGDAVLETRLAEMEELGAGAGVAAGTHEREHLEEPFPFLDAVPTAEGEAEYPQDTEPVPESASAGEQEAGGEWGSPAEAEEREYGEETAPVEAAEPEGFEPAETAPYESASEYTETSAYDERSGYAETGEHAGTAADAEAPEPTGATPQAEAPEAGDPASLAEPVPAEDEYAFEAPPREDVVEAVESAWTGAAGAVAGDDTPYSWTEPAEQEPQDAAVGEGIRSYLLRLAGWSSGRSDVAVDSSPAGTGTAADLRAEEGQEAGAAVEPARAQEGGEVPEAVEEPEARAAAADADATPRGPAPGEDDDLDMFRAWLESLKR